MVRFFARFQAGPSIAKFQQDNRFIENQKLAHPNFWRPFSTLANWRWIQKDARTPMLYTLRIDNRQLEYRGNGCLAESDDWLRSAAVTMLPRLALKSKERRVSGLGRLMVMARSSLNNARTHHARWNGRPIRISTCIHASFTCAISSV